MFVFVLQVVVAVAVAEIKTAVIVVLARAEQHWLAGFVDYYTFAVDVAVAVVFFFLFGGKKKTMLKCRPNQILLNFFQTVNA